MGLACKETCFGVENMPHTQHSVCVQLATRMDTLLIGRNGLRWQDVAGSAPGGAPQCDWSDLDTEMTIFTRNGTVPNCVVLTVICQSIWGCDDSSYTSGIHWSPVKSEYMSAWRYFIQTLCTRYANALDAVVICEEAESKGMSGGESDYEDILDNAYDVRGTARIIHSGTNVGVVPDSGIPNPWPAAAKVWTGGNYDEFSIHANRSYQGIGYFVQHLRNLGVQTPICAEDAATVNAVQDGESGYTDWLDAEDLEVLDFSGDDEDEMYRGHQERHVRKMCQAAKDAELSRCLFTQFRDSAGAAYVQNRLGGVFNTDYSDRPAMIIIREEEPA